METDLDSAAGRLRWAREEAGYSDAADFARAIGMKGVTYRAYESGQNGFAKHAAVFARNLGVPAEWLLEGGPTPEIIRKGRRRSSGEAGGALLFSRDSRVAITDHLPNTNASAGETTPIISLDLSLSMGPGTPIEDFVESEPVEFDIGLLRAITRSPYHRLRIVRGIGDSMEPKFYTGDRILVDTTERHLSRIDGYYWITLWGSHGLKRLRPIGPGKVRVISENSGYEPIDVDAHEITIEGRAIWVGREL